MTRPDPAAVLARLHAETKVLCDELLPTDATAADVLCDRMCSIQDVLFTMPSDDPAALRIQADAIRVFLKDFQHNSREAAVMTLAAAYADRLAATPAPAPASPDQRATMRLHDTTLAMLDALGALNLAIRGLEDEADRRSLSFVAERAGEIASELDDMARELHCGEAADHDSRDTDLHNLITAWRVVEERIAETDSASEHVERSKRLLSKIAATEAQTLRGALAKARVCYDDEEIERLQDSAPVESVGAAGLRDLFRLVEGAQS